jgi:histidinol dehydrogenase
LEEIMLKLYTVEEASGTILQRDWVEPELPESLLLGMERIFGERLTPETAVRQILASIRQNGDAALRDWTRRIDGVDLADARVAPEEMAAAADRLDPELLAGLRLSAERIRAFHARQPLPSWQTNEMGGMLGQAMTPLKRVGVYAPGGSAPLPSSLLMCAIPAQVAGVKDIVVATPPLRPDGRVSDIMLAAAHIAGITELYRMGGAQAVAALAFGTAAIPRVDKIVGAGNLFVTLAKRQLFGYVGLDGVFGPTETVVVADDTADPEWVAADLLAQAEHDPLATAILLTPSRPLAEKVSAAVGRQLEDRARAEIIVTSLAARGGAIITADVAEAVQLADEFAPEHLCLAVADLEKWQGQLRHTGGLFLGERSFEVLGDYVAGPSHIMPTGGTARFASPLNALDFVRITSLIQLDDATANELSVTAAKLALAEGLDAHAYAAQLRVENRRLTQINADLVEQQEKSAQSAKSVDHLIRETVAGMRPYQPIFPFETVARRLGRAPEEIVKLDANENPYGPSPQATAALADGRFFHIYPDPESVILREKLADFTGVPFERLIAGAGADELIDLVLRAIIEPGDVVINCPPSFGMYPFSTAVNAGRLLEIPRKADFGLDVDGIVAAVAAEPRAKILFLCSPNNPDGSLISDADLERLLALPLLVVLDEAYVEFANIPSRMDWTLRYDNLVVLRTFSKWAGLAGLRIGYGAFPDWLGRQIWKIKQPYNVNVAASLAAVASLDALPALLVNVAKIKAERERLLTELERVEWLRPYPSQANFILCRVDGRSALDVKERLAQQGVLIRYFDTPLLQNYIRISVGRPEDTAVLLAALG